METDRRKRVDSCNWVPPSLTRRSRHGAALWLPATTHSPLSHLHSCMEHTHSSIKEMILKFLPAPTDSMESRYSVSRPLFQVQVWFLMAWWLKLKVKFSAKMKKTVPSVGRMGNNRTSPCSCWCRNCHSHLGKLLAVSNNAEHLCSLWASSFYSEVDTWWRCEQMCSKRNVLQHSKQHYL